jgi:hypothetical protein
MRDNVDKEKLFPILEAEKRFKFNIEAVGRKMQPAEVKQIIDSFEVFPFKPKIDLKNPEITFEIIEIADE